MRNTLGDYIKNSEFEAVKLSNSTTLENRQQQNSVEHETEDTGGGVSLLQSSQTGSVYINLEADECVNYSTQSSSASDIAADATFSHKLTRYFPELSNIPGSATGDVCHICIWLLNIFLSDSNLAGEVIDKPGCMNEV